ncbi:hypothetical protein AB3329_00905 [Streptococcus sp. H31]|uniref:hypothetical protein n=1 Tax=Streptococcus huangxiaojuni TaxID=3237239 RepID=UPI0034A28170
MKITSKKIFIYDKEIQKKYILDIINLIEKFKNKAEFILEKGWSHGLHINLGYTKFTNDYDEKVFLEKLERLNSSYIWRYSNHSKVDYKLYEEYVIRLKKIEKISDEVLPLEEQFSVKTGPYKLNRIVYNDDFVEDKLLATRLLVLFYKEYYHSSPEVRSLLLVKIMIILTNLTNFGPDFSERKGVFLAYYSFKSHVEGFKKSFDSFPNEKKSKLNAKIEYLTKEEEKFINFGFENFLMSTTDFDKCKKLVAIVEKTFSEQITMGEVKFNGDYLMSNYLANDEDLSNYHTKLKSIADLEMFLQKEFVLGRCMLNWFYSILPMFAVSPLERHRLCNIIVKCVEGYRNKNWEELLIDFFS